MTSLLLTTFPSLACRPAGAVSSRLGYHIVNHRRGNAVPWATCQQIRFASGEKDNNEDDHYATIGAKPSDPIEKIRARGNALLMATHPDHNDGIRNSDFYKVYAAMRIIGSPGKKAIYDPMWWAKYGEPQAKAAAARQRGADALRAAVVAKELARLREEANRAAETAKAEEAKKRDEERKARKREKREAQRAEAERQKKATEEERKAAEERKENERIAAAEKKKAQEEIARKKAEKKKKADEEAAAARKAREAELARQQEREARLVVLR